jgi:hypothetical protein
VSDTRRITLSELSRLVSESAGRIPDRGSGGALREAGRTHSQLLSARAVRFDRVDVLEAVTSLGV